MACACCVVSLSWLCLYTEEDDTEVLEGKFNFWKTFAIATKYMLFVACLVALAVGLTFYFLGYSNIPVGDYKVSIITGCRPRLVNRSENRFY